MLFSFHAKNQKYFLEITKGEDLLFAIDNFLKSNRIDVNALKDLKLVKGAENGLTSLSACSVGGRIAETIIKIFNFVLS